MAGPPVESVSPGFFTRAAAEQPLLTYFALAYFLSWLVFVPMAVFHLPGQWTILASFGPCAAALITHYLRTGNLRAFRLIGSIRRSVMAACLGIALTVLAYVIIPAVSAANPSKLNWSILISPAVYNYSTILGGPLGEEFGWRGYALPLLEKRFGPLTGCVVLGVLWAGWHLPLFLGRGWYTSPFWIYVLIVTGLSIIMGFTSNLAAFAVLPAILIHSMFNTVSRFLNGMFATVQPSTHMPFELVLALGGLGVGLVLVLLTKGRLGYRAEAAEIR